VWELLFQGGGEVVDWERDPKDENVTARSPDGLGLLDDALDNIVPTYGLREDFLDDVLEQAGRTFGRERLPRAGRVNGYPGREARIIIQQLHRWRTNKVMHVGLVVDVLGMAQTPVHRQAKGLAVTEELGRAKEALESGRGPTDGYRACIEGTDEDLAGFRRPLLFLHVSANINRVFVCIYHLFGMYGI